MAQVRRLPRRAGGVRLRDAVDILAVPVIAVATGCGVEGSTPDSGEPSAPAVTDAPRVPWTEVTDGTWESGDYALGQPNKMRLSDYAITVAGPPTLTTSDGGQRCA